MFTFIKRLFWKNTANILHCLSALETVWFSHSVDWATNSTVSAVVEIVIQILVPSPTVCKKDNILEPGPNFSNSPMGELLKLGPGSKNVIFGRYGYTKIEGSGLVAYCRSGKFLVTTCTTHVANYICITFLSLERQLLVYPPALIVKLLRTFIFVCFII